MSSVNDMQGPCDSFDPTLDIGFGESDYVEYVPPIEKPDDEEEVEPKPLPPASERIASLIKGMPGYEKLLYEVIEFCRSLRESDEVAAFIEDRLCGSVSVYSPETICANLVGAGALDLVAKGGGDSDFGVQNHDEEDGFIQPVAPTSFGYQSTPDGLASLDADDSQKRLDAIVSDDARYAPVHKALLEACMGESGLTKKEVDALIDRHPLCESPRRYSGYFLKRLEAADALVFDGYWHTTFIGEKLLDSLGGCKVL